MWWPVDGGLLPQLSRSSHTLFYFTRIFVLAKITLYFLFTSSDHRRALRTRKLRHLHAARIYLLTLCAQRADAHALV